MQTTAPEIANVGELTSRAARIHAKRLAVTSAQRSATYEELEQRSNRLANALCGLGLQRGDRVGVYLPNCIEIVELELACYKAALVKAPINARLAPVEVAEVIANSEATLIVTTAERAESFLPQLKSAPRLLLLDAAEDSPTSYEGALSRASDRFTPARVSADELAVLHYTSGSSGVLKAAMQTFGNRLAQLRKFLMRADNLQPGDLLGLVGPITHASGMQLVPALCSGATIRLFSGFDPARFIAEMKRERVTHTFMVPTMINMLLAEVQGRYRPLPDLRRLGYGAAPMAPARIMQAMDVFGPVLSQGYGAGETTSGVCGLSVEDHLFARAAMPERLASCGRPFLESRVDIVDDEGQPVAAGEIGEIVVGGADVFAGYWRAPELTAEVLKNGCYHTGDLARVDDDGYIYIVDRKKDMVISGGFNVYPSEVEAVLYQHAAVDEACVFSVPDDKWGEAVAAHIVLKAGSAADAAALDAFCAERLAGFKRPRRIEFVEALQKNANGKIARKLIQSPYWVGHDRRVN
ncbi:acyl-CoA synthetase (AMP-forming)/AMP-acid ligase II [Variovorax paradoxus]|uniref:Acyl-CoA synthetase (AMP-forming)/AMP-acid ligase II n=1 Tax=Variovorax paradoxus TaxID=34073 RepID=A0AAE3Y5G3_VARPD|nr:AMP-binding protein [Variovorax paradoxus]MDP9968242.1 acyl-CoA synthetase (AMP-forming)/AMP-acid ligase II [Variovorax paradoxus]MDR6429681.1 acyl-CoA synthetase (AMP-forming)/AMP-acid ligase II [Variovorax paradoxus]